MGPNLVSNRLPRVAGATHAGVVTVQKMGSTREISNFEHQLGTDTTLGLMTALGVMYPDNHTERTCHAKAADLAKKAALVPVP